MNSPRIYTYKITFEEVPYYYYGVHKEKKFDEYYMGSPKTNKWAWSFYTPKKQILQLFEYTNDGWMKALEIENQLIKPFYIADKWCLNANCGLELSLMARSKNGKKAAKVNKEKGTAIFPLTPDQRKQIGEDSYKRKVGIHTLTSEERSEYGKQSAKKRKEMNTGIFKLTPEQLSVNARLAGLKTFENKVGIHALTSEQLSEYGKIGGKKGAEAINGQRWICLETGFISTPGGLSHYQRKRGIDKTKRKRLK